MAHIFKHPSNGQKGIVSFTHKEIRYFYSNHPYFKTGNRIINKILPSKSSNAHSSGIAEPFKQQLEQIQKSYFVGVHFGWHHEDFPALNGLDFYLGGPGTVSFQDPSAVNFIPLDGSNFIPTCFYLEASKKHLKLWDVLMVSRDVKWKNLDLFLKAIRTLYDKGNMLDVLLIVPSNHIEAKDKDPSVTYTNLLSDYERMFSYEERGHFSIIKTHPNMPFLGMTQPQIAKFYHLAKVFALFSKVEGGSRVISEALLAGLPVVVKSDLKGGGRDLLDESNAVFFDEFDSAHLALEQAVDQWTTLNTDNSKVKSLALETDALESLKSHFSKMYASVGGKFDGTLINTDWLSFRINGHWHQGLPWAADQSKDADILSKEQFRTFIQQLEL